VSGSPPADPALSFLRRRPGRRRGPGLQRTGNAALDFSADPVRGEPLGAAMRWSLFGDVAPLRGLTVLSADRPRVLIGGPQASAGSMHLTLTWSTLPPDPRAAAAGLRRSTDLHLGCLWEMNDRSSGLIQTFAEGNLSARCEGNTVLRLGARSETEGQTLTLAVRHLSLLRRMVVFAYADNGFPQWATLAPLLTGQLRDGVIIECRFGPPPDWGTICAIASLHRVGGVLVLRRENEYLNGQQQTVGEVFGFDLPWVAGRTVRR
jgi:tellurite resistance protein TerA